MLISFDSSYLSFVSCHSSRLNARSEGRHKELLEQQKKTREHTTLQATQTRVQSSHHHNLDMKRHDETQAQLDATKAALIKKLEEERELERQERERERQERERECREREEALVKALKEEREHREQENAKLIESITASVKKSSLSVEQVAYSRDELAPKKCIFADDETLPTASSTRASSVPALVHTHKENVAPTGKPIVVQDLERESRAWERKCREEVEKREREAKEKQLVEKENQQLVQQLRGKIRMEQIQDAKPSKSSRRSRREEKALEGHLTKIDTGRKMSLRKRANNSVKYGP